MSIAVRRSGLATALAVALLCPIGGLAPRAQANFPGKPGLVVFNLTFHEQGQSDYPGGLYAIRPGANQPRQLTDNPWDYEPSFAPSGRRVVFRRLHASPSGLVVLDLDSGDTSRLAPTRDSDMNPAFGRRGEVAFVRFTEHSYDLFLRTASGRLHRLTRTDRAKEQTPVFTPDGRRIIFVRNYGRVAALRTATRSSPGERIYSIRTDGTGLRLVGEVKDASGLDVSPNGRDLAFDAFESNPVQSPGTAVWTKRLEGGAQHVISANAGDPTYSPAGDEIAYWNYQGIWTVGADGRGRTLVYGAEYAAMSGGGALAIDPAWQPQP